MNLLELSELLLDEKKAEEYLLKVGILKTFTACEKCESTRITKISRGRHRCNNCLSEWSNRAGSILHRQSLSASKFIGLVKLFELELTATEVEKELLINERTVQRIYEKIRVAIVGETNAPHHGIIKKQTPYFAISIVDGVVNITLDASIAKANLFKLRRTRVPSKETSYNFHYTNVKPKEIEKCLNQLPLEQNYFWRYAKIKLLDFRGTKVEYLFQYLKEIEFRYNNRIDNIFDKTILKIAHFEGWR